MNTLLSTSLSLLMASAMLTSPVHAREAGDLVLRAGIANANPSNPSGNPTELDVQDDTQLGITATYMFTSNWGIGVLGSSPFSHDVHAGGSKIAETKHLPPTVTAQYHFATSNAVAPYVGLGVNYTAFFDEKLNDGTAIELDDSVGLAIEAGIDYNLANDWIINASAWFIDIETTVTAGGSTVTDQVDIDPVVLMLGIGKVF